MAQSDQDTGSLVIWIQTECICCVGRSTNSLQSAVYPGALSRTIEQVEIQAPYFSQLRIAHDFALGQEQRTSCRCGEGPRHSALCSYCNGKPVVPRTPAAFRHPITRSVGVLACNYNSL